MPEYELGFIGAGNMAEAICRAVLARGVFSADQVTAYDLAEARVLLFREQFKLQTSPDNPTVVRRSQTVILAVKPQQMAEVLDEIKPAVADGQLLISIAAGISTKFIETSLGKPVPVVRVMPNTPLLAGEGMAGLCRGAHADNSHLEFASKIFASAGQVTLTEEPLMDAITAISGSGPAYFFYLVEAMVRAGEELGLSYEQSLRLSTQTCLGAGRMMIETGIDPAELRRAVTSPGGTTEAALRVIEGKHVKGTMVEAIKAAAERSEELGK